MYNIYYNISSIDKGGQNAMAKLYGTLQGCRGEATRVGSTTSGIRASIQSYKERLGK